VPAGPPVLSLVVAPSPGAPDPEIVDALPEPLVRLAAVLLVDPGALVSERRLSLAAGPTADLELHLAHLADAMARRGWDLVRLPGGAVLVAADR